jgi:hypothetical protein
METVNIPIRRQTYENLEEVRNMKIPSTPVRPKKTPICPDAPQRKVKIFTPSNPISNFKKLNLEDDTKISFS